ncbi:MAG: ISAs1 family transposase, partial [Janthinobacterium lividum]
HAVPYRKDNCPYTLALKQNQGELHRQVAAHFAPLIAQPAAHQQRDEGHGRGELRQVWVSQHWGLVDAGADWLGLQTLVCQQTTRWVAGKAQQATRYFLSSLVEARAATLAGYMRGHWGMENQQPWHLDVTFAEDASQCRRDQAPRNLSTIRKLALTLLQRSALVMSLKRKRKKSRSR